MTDRPLSLFASFASVCSCHSALFVYVLCVSVRRCGSQAVMCPALLGDAVGRFREVVRALPSSVCVCACVVDPVMKEKMTRMTKGGL